MQTSALKNISMNGDFHYTNGTMSMPSYYENATGLNTLNANGTANRSVTWSGGYAGAHRAVIGADYGIIWQASPRVSLADQVDVLQHASARLLAIFRHRPRWQIRPERATEPSIIPARWLPERPRCPMVSMERAPSTSSARWTSSTAPRLRWDVSARARFALTYRYSNRIIGEGVPHNGPITTTTDPVAGQISINEDTGIFNATLHPAKNWDLNGSVEVGYFDNSFTTVLPRQFKQYRVHTIYRPNGKVTVSGSYSDRERHNNTYVGSQDEPYVGPVNHIDYARIGTVTTVISPNEHYSFDVSYSYDRVYAATNICFSSGATATAPGAATVTASGAPNLCPVAPPATPSTWYGRDFMDAPTQFGSASFSWIPTDKVRTHFGYTASDVNGSRFFNDARDVNGSMVSLYQSPFASLAYTMHPGLSGKRNSTTSDTAKADRPALRCAARQHPPQRPSFPAHPSRFQRD